jgi:hypothetical protein
VLKQTIRRFLIYAFSKLRNQIIFGFIKGAKFLLTRYPKNSIFFENISAQKDGYGAQIQRILSIKSLANSVEQPFIFNPLTEVEDQITQKTLSCEEKTEEISQFNFWLSDLLGSQGEAVNSFNKIIQINSPFELFYQSLRFPFLSRKKQIKFRLENAYFITNTNPDLYLSIIAPNNFVKDNLSKMKEIHVHVRFVNFSIGTFRSLNSDYYFETLDRVTSKLDETKTDYKIVLHSDFSSPFDDSRHRQITQMTENHLFEMQIIDSENVLDKNILDAAFNLLNAIHDRYLNVEISKSQTPLSSLQSMASADFLILSKSSFAFVAGILNQRGEIYSPEYWIRLPTSWIIKSGF